VSFSLAISYALSGESMWGYHLLNLLMHLGNALLLYGLSGAPCCAGGGPVVRRRGRALGALRALIWVVHPLHANSVTYIITRTELLVSLFFLLTFYCAIRAWESQGGGWGWTAAAFVYCVIGMATKENMVVLPVLLWLYDRTFFSGGFWAALRRHFVLYLLLAASWGMLGYLVSVQDRPATGTQFGGVTFRLPAHAVRRHPLLPAAGAVSQQAVHLPPDEHR